MVKRIVLVAIPIILIGCSPKKEEAPAAAIVVDKEQVKAEIQAMETAFADNYNAGKAEGIVYYADDATSYGQNKAPQVGKAAIDKAVKEEVAAAPKGSKIAFAVTDVFPSSDGNQVVELGSYKVSDSTNTVKFSGNYMSLFEKRDGKYTCIRDMSASDMPKEKK